MKVIFGIGRVKRIKRSVVTLGIFDGLHLGHLRILNAVTSYARQINGKSVVITFTPHPQSENNLYSLEHRIKGFRKIGIDICIVVRFTDSFSRISAIRFIRDFLIKKINPRCVFVGDNFTFGKHARGTPSLLKRYADQRNFKLKIFPIYKLHGKAVSSTHIRQLIKKGCLNQAERLLGRPVTILGTVVRGSSLARDLGFPTANIKAHHEVLPPSGVYIVEVIFQNKKFKGLCYIGDKPTLKRKKIIQLKPQNVHIEVHIFGFNKNLYGKDLEVQFIKKIREEKKFTSIELLVEQIKNDVKYTQSQC